MDPTEDPQNMEEELDSDITSIRAEIRTLQRRKRLLASSILSSSEFQKRVKSLSAPSLTSLAKKLSPLLTDAENHADVNHHRIAFSATSFPFKDPDPNARDQNLLGLRIDLCQRDGRFVKPYYVLLKRVESGKENGEKRLKVHRHTIPAFIPMESLERVYLPGASSGSATEGGERGDDVAAMKARQKATKPRKQDLQGLVRELRRQLVAWQLRVDAIGLLRETLGVVRRGVDDYQDDDGVWERNFLNHKEETRLEANDLGIVSLGPTALEAVYVRVEWASGQVGRFKISNSGIVERAVVIGDNGRDKALEVALTGGNARVETVLDRLKKHAEAKA
ncbi:hypothetical protein P170DRAFT_402791 [Aspergillus steynii IBT 23096]|uniref:Cenp-O kinetochore centromere component n=1 Tax=Aspergillus steynii IBT 23096 TaxID=1392250 RepID=A0A2I2GI26_9EURO|nr:uncharacterized protein P170DRAFT_402791 [Aspergillus steynii IBT 23096]PLB52538.1 hypothetical protein P170DRAFT_402791 [Aspergillus steynii IBT 23096]